MPLAHSKKERTERGILRHTYPSSAGAAWITLAPVPPEVCKEVQIHEPSDKTEKYIMDNRPTTDETDVPVHAP